MPDASPILIDGVWTSAGSGISREIQNPATLRRLIVDLIDAEDWSKMQADVKGDIY